MAASKTPAKPKTPAARPAAKKKAAASAAVAPAPVEADASAMQVKAAGLKLKEFLARVAAQVDAPKKTQREVSEAVLGVLGAALAAGEEINLPGFGRAKVVKSADKGGSPVLTVKVKNAGVKKGPSAKEPLAEDGEDS